MPHRARSCPRKRTLLPRMVLLLLTYAVGGAIVNVAVAWGCYATAANTTTSITDEFRSRFGITNRIETRKIDEGVIEWTVLDRCIGWPLRCTTLTLDSSLAVWRNDRSKNFPITAIWPGFAINTVFYAAVLWLLFAGPGWARRLIRARRGQCPACAYPIGASDVCTECGTRIGTEARRHAGTKGQT